MSEIKHIHNKLPKSLFLIWFHNHVFINAWQLRGNNSCPACTNQVKLNTTKVGICWFLVKNALLMRLAVSEE